VAAPGRGAAGGRAVGLATARRAIAADGDARVGPGAFVVELDPTANIAAGVVPWGVGAVLAELDPDVRTIRCPPPSADPTVAAGPDPPSLLRRAAGRPLVLVVRDLHRHDWQRALARALIDRRPDTIVVEMGLPVARPDGAAAWVRTHGAGRANGRAAAEVLLGKEGTA
jgi:beta-N-acetylhexosaminidase